MKYKILNQNNRIEIEDNADEKYPILSSFLSGSSVWTETLYEILNDMHSGKTIAEANPAHANPDEPELVIFDETEVTLGVDNVIFCFSSEENTKEVHDTKELRLLLQEFLQR